MVDGGHQTIVRCVPLIQPEPALVVLCYRVGKVVCCNAHVARPPPVPTFFLSFRSVEMAAHAQESDCRMRQKWREKEQLQMFSFAVWCRCAVRCLCRHGCGRKLSSFDSNPPAGFVWPLHLRAVFPKCAKIRWANHKLDARVHCGLRSSFRALAGFCELTRNLHAFTPFSVHAAVSDVSTCAHSLFPQCSPLARPCWPLPPPPPPLIKPLHSRPLPARSASAPPTTLHADPLPLHVLLLPMSPPQSRWTPWARNTVTFAALISSPVVLLWNVSTSFLASRYDFQHITYEYIHHIPILFLEGLTAGTCQKLD